jgi:hypothetical protein
MKGDMARRAVIRLEFDFLGPWLTEQITRSV